MKEASKPPPIRRRLTLRSGELVCLPVLTVCVTISRNAAASRKPAYDMSAVALLDAEVVLVLACAMRTEDTISQARVALLLVGL